MRLIRLIKESPFVLVILAVLVNLWVLFPETTVKSELNDNVFAFTLVRQTDEVWRASGCPLSIFKCLSSLSDFWVPTWALGFPLPHYYQHIPHLVPVLIYRFLRLFTLNFSLFTTFEWFKYLLLALFPLSIYWAARKLELPPIAAGLAALMAPLISTQYLYGTDFNAVVWRGSGMYTQLWGFVTAPLALASLYDTIRYRRAILRSALLLALAFSGHLVFGYIVALSLPVLVLSVVLASFRYLSDLSILGNLGNLLKPFFRPVVLLTLTVTLTFLLLSYWAVPLIVNNSWDNSHSVWDDRSKFDSYGMLAVTQKLVNGDLFDANRLPVLTTLVFIGFFAALISFLSSHESHKTNKSYETYSSSSPQSPLSYLFLPLMFIEWYFLYWGRATWGPLAGLLPMADGIHFHRFINGLQLAGIFLAGVGLAFVYEKLNFYFKLYLPRLGLLFNPKAPVALNKSSRTLVVFCLLLTVTFTIVLLAPIYQERLAYLSENSNLIDQANYLFDKDYPDFVKTVDYLKANHRGRIWVGRPGNWGNDFNVGETHAFMEFSMAGIDVSGFLPETWSPNSDVEQFFDEKRLDHYQAFGLRTLVVPPDHEVPAEARKVAQFGKFVVYDMPQVSEFEVATVPFKLISSKKNDLSILRMWLESNWPAHQAHPFVFLNGEPPSVRAFPIDTIRMKNLSDYSYKPANGSAGLETNLFAQNPFQFAPPATPSGQVANETGGLNDYGVTVSVPQTKTGPPLFLVLKASYHPYWSATIDNRSAEIFPVAPVFMAVPLPPCAQAQCRYQVNFSYRPSTLKKALLILSLGTLILALAFRKRLKTVFS